jgi:hypothetical protein
MRSDSIDVASLASIMELTYQMFLDGAIRERDEGLIPNDRIVDSHFVDLMADPVGSLRTTYEQLELDWPEGHDMVVTAYLRDKPKDKHGAHTYSLEDVGLDPDSVRKSFANYVSHYAIEEE